MMPTVFISSFTDCFSRNVKHFEHYKIVQETYKFTVRNSVTKKFITEVVFRLTELMLQMKKVSILYFLTVTLT